MLFLYVIIQFRSALTPIVATVALGVRAAVHLDGSPPIVADLGLRHALSVVPP